MQFRENAKWLVVSNVFGVTVFADAKGLYVGRTTSFLENLQAWDAQDSEQPPTDRCRVCCCSIDWPGVTALHLTAADQLLAVHDQARVKLYSLHTMVVQGKPEPLLELSGPTEGIHQMCFADVPDSNIPPSFALLTKPQQLHYGSVPQFPGEVVSSGVSCMALSQDGRWLARGEQDVVIVRDVASGAEWREHITSKGVEESDSLLLSVDSLAWMGECQLMVGITICEAKEEGEEREANFAPLGVLTWKGEGGQDTLPEELTFCEFDTAHIVPEATPELSGLHLLHCSIPAWKLLLVTHRKVADDHVKLLGVASDGDALEAVDVLEDACMLRVPRAMGDNDNYIIGVSIDYSSTGQIPVLHPTDNQCPPLPASPAVMLATSDGKLRCYTFADSTATASIVQPPVPLWPISAQLEAALKSVTLTWHTLGSTVHQTVRRAG